MRVAVPAPAACINALVGNDLLDDSCAIHEPITSNLPEMDGKTTRHI
jgi:hypothetical protein